MTAVLAVVQVQVMSTRWCALVGDARFLIIKYIIPTLISRTDE